MQSIQRTLGNTNQQHPPHGHKFISQLKLVEHATFLSSFDELLMDDSIVSIMCQKL